MKTTRTEKITIAVVAALLIGFGVLVARAVESMHDECAAKGGVLLRGNGYVCVDIKVIK